MYIRREISDIQKRLPESENMVEKAKKDLELATRTEEKSTNDVSIKILEENFQKVEYCSLGYKV